MIGAVASLRVTLIHERLPREKTQVCTESDRVWMQINRRWGEKNRYYITLTASQRGSASCSIRQRKEWTMKQGYQSNPKCRSRSSHITALTKDKIFIFIIRYRLFQNAILASPWILPNYRLVSQPVVWHPSQLVDSAGTPFAQSIELSCRGWPRDPIIYRWGA